MEQQAGINIRAYVDGKEKNTARVVKINGVAHLSVRAFDGTTGAPIPVLQPVDLASAEKALETMKADLAAMEQIVADIRDAKEIMPQS